MPESEKQKRQAEIAKIYHSEIEFKSAENKVSWCNFISLSLPLSLIINNFNQNSIGIYDQSI